MKDEIVYLKDGDENMQQITNIFNSLLNNQKNPPEGGNRKRRKRSRKLIRKSRRKSIRGGMTRNLPPPRPRQRGSRSRYRTPVPMAEDRPEVPIVGLVEAQNQARYDRDNPPVDYSDSLVAVMAFAVVLFFLY